MKVIRSLFIAIPASVLVSFAAQADGPAARQQAPPQQQPQQQYAPQQQYQQYQQYQEGGGGYIQQGIPPQGYYCGTPCLPPPPVVVMPVPVPIPMPPAILPPVPTPYNPGIYCPPNCGGGWNGGGRVWGGGGGRMPPPVAVAPGGTGGYIRRMSGTVGCEVQRGNNGEVVVLSAGGAVIYANSSERAEENAEIMKTYYENGNTGLCGAANSADKVHSI